MTIIELLRLLHFTQLYQESVERLVWEIGENTKKPVTPRHQTNHVQTLCQFIFFYFTLIKLPYRTNFYFIFANHPLDILGPRLSKTKTRPGRYHHITKIS